MDYQLQPKSLETTDLVYSWDKFEEDVKDLTQKIDFSYYDCLCGIATGGLPLLTKLVNLTKKPYIIVQCSSYDGRSRNKLQVDFGNVVVSDKKILLVDDVADSGTTIKQVTEGLYWKGAPSVEILTLFYKSQSIVIPEWYLHEVENHQWITFPWE